MPDLSAFAITKRWPAQNPEIIQVYSVPTPNGQKVTIALEEMGLPYEAHRISFDGDTTTPEFLSLNPNNKIPAIIDPNGPDGAPIGLFESGAILIYLAEKTGQLLPKDARGRYKTLQWLMFQMGGVGPMFGQLGYFHRFAGSEIKDPRSRQRYIEEAQRLLDVVEAQLERRDWITGTYSIADIALAPWIDALEFYGAKDAVGWQNYPNAAAYVTRIFARPAAKRGMDMPPRPT